MLATSSEASMRCPFCRLDNDRVIDSRAGDDGATIRS
jgi:transcriptional regulator NrdR family protein